jgi:hypothetical protein
MSGGEPGTIEAGRLAAVARLLHQDSSHVRALYEASETFREIYADFATCQERIERFRQLGRVDDPHVQQYVEMRDQLEREIRVYLERAPGSER